MLDVQEFCLTLKAELLNEENAVDLLIRSNELNVEILKNLSMNFVAEHLQGLRESLDGSGVHVVLLEEIMVLCQKRMIVSKLI